MGAIWGTEFVAEAMQGDGDFAAGGVDPLTDLRVLVNGEAGSEENGEGYD